VQLQYCSVKESKKIFRSPKTPYKEGFIPSFLGRVRQDKRLNRQVLVAVIQPGFIKKTGFLNYQSSPATEKSQID
jgi:hypothetical protein